MTQTFTSYEVILVDNGSTDESVEFVRRKFPGVKLIENHRNLGFSEGNNIGIRSAVGDYVILLNNDTTVRPDFVETLTDIASSDPSIGSVGCKLVHLDPMISYGPIFTNKGFIVPWFSGGRIMRNRVMISRNVDGYCLANCAAAVLYRKRALDAVGNLDNFFWTDWEDNDLGFRLCVAGYRNFYTTKTSVTHHGRGTFGRVPSSTRYRRIIRNMLLTHFKNYEPPNIASRFLILLLVVPFYLIAGGVSSVIRHVVFHSGFPSQASLALPLAYLDFMRNLGLFMHKRAMIQSQRKIHDSEIFSQTELRWLV